MQYIKVTFTLDPDNEVNREILTAYLSELEFESFDETDENLNAFYPVGKVSAETIQAVLDEVLV